MFSGLHRGWNRLATRVAVAQRHLLEHLRRCRVNRLLRNLETTLREDLANLLRLWSDQVLTFKRKGH